jgi:glyoxylase-like metal-dependent hydrolase (beta-lactamase superfamily II)
MVVLDEATGTLFAADAVGARIGGAALYPTTPPADQDPVAARATLARLRELAPDRMLLGHFAEVPDVGEALDTADRQAADSAAAVRAAWAARPTRESVASALAAALDASAAMATPEALARWSMLRWMDQNVDGMAGWAARDAEAASA